MNLSEILFPHTCVGCGSLGTHICLHCSHKMRPIYENWCLSCGNTLNKTAKCAHCEGKRVTIPVLGYYYYESVVSRAIWSLKYKGDRHTIFELCSRINPRLLSELLVLKEKSKKTSLVPVPLHESRERERGYNQSYLIARFLSATTDIPIENNLLKRVKITKPQAKCKSKKERMQNIQGAFVVTKRDELQKETIVLVDDVVTTGLTVKEIAREIRNKLSTTELSVVCLARERDNNVEI